MEAVPANMEAAVPETAKPPDQALADAWVDILLLAPRELNTAASPELVRNAAIWSAGRPQQSETIVDAGQRPEPENV